MPMRYSPSRRASFQVGGDHPHRDGRDRLEGAAQQPGDGGLVGALGQVGTTSSKSRVNRAPGRAQGTVSVRTRPQARQASRRISACRYSRAAPRSRCRQRRMERS